jgi:hypothetical protein
MKIWSDSIQQSQRNNAASISPVNSSTDEITLYCLSYAARLKTLPSEAVDDIRCQMESLMREARLKFKWNINEPLNKSVFFFKDFIFQSYSITLKLNLPFYIIRKAKSFALMWNHRSQTLRIIWVIDIHLNWDLWLLNI